MTSTEVDLVLVRQALIEERAHTTEQMAAREREFDSIVEASRLTATDDEHDPEGSTIAFERSQSSALIHSAQHHLTEIDRAIERIDAGTFGVCESCGQPIAAGRLEARPWAHTCVSCA